jgi:hypothetical protein
MNIVLEKMQSSLEKNATNRYIIRSGEKKEHAFERYRGLFL